MVMMHDKVKAFWLEALRSDEYKQTVGSLAGAEFLGKDADGADLFAEQDPEGPLCVGNCCLGVLAEVLDKNRDLVPDDIGFDVVREGLALGVVVDKDKWKSKTNWSVIPDELWNALLDNPEFAVKGELINMNDEGRTFNEIADYIEEHL